MAAIDKMYVHSYYEYDDLRRWAIAYYPELLFHFYTIDLTYSEWQKSVDKYVSDHIEMAKKHYERLGKFNTPDEAAYNQLKKLAEQGIQLNIENTLETVNFAIKAYNRSESDWEGLYERAIMNTPCDVDKKLLWICPVPCVRKYLKEHCGYETKWYHKLFWKGKKHF